MDTGKYLCMRLDECVCVRKFTLRDLFIWQVHDFFPVCYENLCKTMNEFFINKLFLPSSRSTFHIYVVCRFDDFCRYDMEHNHHSCLSVGSQYIPRSVYVSFLTGKC